LKTESDGKTTSGQESTGEPPAQSPWVVLIVVLLTGMAGPINYYKAPPLLPSLMSDLHLSGGVAGFLMSVFAVVGILLSIPAGLILQRLGYRITGLVAVGWLALGAGTGALATGPVTLLLTRLMEGIGLNLLAISSPTAVALHFAGKRRSLAVGIWNAWYPLGSSVTFLTAPFLASLWGWRAAWWFGCLYALAVGVLYFSVIRPDQGGRSKVQATAAGGDQTETGWKSTFRNREVWIMSFMFFSFSFMYIGYVTWTPTFLYRTRGFPLSGAAFMMSILSVAAMASSPLSGWLLSRLRSPKAAAIAVPFVFSLLTFLTCFLGTGSVVPLAIVLGLISGFMPSISLSVVARLIHQRKVGPIAFSMVTMGQNIGILLGPTLMGIAMGTQYGWPLAYALFIPAGLAGVAAAALMRRESQGMDEE